MSNADGGPAFPVIAENGLGHVTDGMTLRDYFAAKALQGFLADSGARLVDQQIRVQEGSYVQDNDARKRIVNSLIAENCYDLADAMIAERAK